MAFVPFLGRANYQLDETIFGGFAQRGNEDGTNGNQPGTNRPGPGIDRRKKGWANPDMMSYFQKVC
jgi:hypothetical protein